MNGNWRHNADGLADEKQREPQLGDFTPDIVCAQESLHPREYFTAESGGVLKHCVHEFVSHGKWGSAIYSRMLPLEPVHLQKFSGSVVGAKILNPSADGQARSAMIFSLHAPTSRSYVGVVNEILDEIRKVWDGQPLILAGDFNVTTAFRHPSEIETKNSKKECELLTRLRMDFGLVNAWQTLNPNQNLPQTLRWSTKPSVPYHCDAVFVSHHFVPQLISARVESSGDWGKMSDHNPLLVDIA